MRSRPLVLPLLVGLVAVPAAITALGFALHGGKVADAVPFSGSRVPSAPPGPASTHPTKGPVRPTVEPAEVAPPAPALVRQGPSSPFGRAATAFAPGGGDFIGRGGGVPPVAHAWTGGTVAHRCDGPAWRRAGSVREFLIGRAVPAKAVSAGVVIDPVRCPPSDGGPQVDVLVG